MSHEFKLLVVMKMTEEIVQNERLVENCSELIDTEFSTLRTYFTASLLRSLLWVSCLVWLVFYVFYSYFNVSWWIAPVLLTVYLCVRRKALRLQILAWWDLMGISRLEGISKFQGQLPILLIELLNPSLEGYSPSNHMVKLFQEPIERMIENLQKGFPNEIM